MNNLSKAELSDVELTAVSGGIVPDEKGRGCTDRGGLGDLMDVVKGDKPAPKSKLETGSGTGSDTPKTRPTK